MELSTIITFLLYGLLIWFIYKRFAPVKGLKNLNEKDFKEEASSADSFLIDVREAHEYNRGYIPNAVNIPLSQLKRRINDVPQGKKILLYCQSGMRSKAAARIITNSGHANIAHLKGGIMAWSGRTKSR